MLTKHTEQAHQDLFLNSIIDQHGNLLVNLEELLAVKDQTTLFMRSLYEQYQHL